VDHSERQVDLLARSVENMNARLGSPGVVAYQMAPDTSNARNEIRYRVRISSEKDILFNNYEFEFTTYRHTRILSKALCEVEPGEVFLPYLNVIDVFIKLPDYMVSEYCKKYKLLGADIAFVTDFKVCFAYEISTGEVQKFLSDGCVLPASKGSLSPQALAVIADANDFKLPDPNSSCMGTSYY
jgi:hypothetical protein